MIKAIQLLLKQPITQESQACTLQAKGLKGDAVWGTRNDWVILTGIKG